MSNNRSSCGCGNGSVVTFVAAPDAPIVCTLGRDDMLTRAKDFMDAFEHLVKKERFAGGFRWTFHNEPGFEGTLRELARREHACCQFVTFTLTTVGDHIVWETRGPAAAEDVIEIFFRTPETLHGDLGALKQQAEQAGLSFADRTR